MANRRPWWLWLVGKDRGNGGKQNPSGGVTGNWRNYDNFEAFHGFDWQLSKRFLVTRMAWR